MSGWAGQMRAYEDQQSANNNLAARFAEKKAKNRFNSNKKETEETFYSKLGASSSVGNKLRVLHNTGKGNIYYKKRMSELKRGNVEGVLNKLKKHKKRKNYTKTGSRSARGELLNKTIGQLNREIKSGMHQSHQGGSKSKQKEQVRGRRVLKNGVSAGYVKQKNGTWKWSFLKRN